jgi:hypothetical protein
LLVIDEAHHCRCRHLGQDRRRLAERHGARRDCDPRAPRRRGPA